MVIEIKKGDIFESKSEAIVNTVNCVGIMGKGLALQFKINYPDNFFAYLNECNCNKMNIGKMFVFKTSNKSNPKYIINFPTKRHWKDISLLKDIEVVLKSLINEINKL